MLCFEKNKIMTLAPGMLPWHIFQSEGVKFHSQILSSQNLTLLNKFFLIQGNLYQSGHELDLEGGRLV